MESREKKYYEENSSQSTSSNLTRSSRNSRLYKQVYGKYENLDNLPLDDNTDEIDMEKLKELLLNEMQKKDEREIKNNLNILEQRKRQIDEQKIYDINKILEKAKYENNKLKDSTTSLPKRNKEILSTLESTELSVLDIKKESEKYEQQLKKEQQKILQEQDKEEKLSMTRELRYQSLNQEQEIKKEENLSNSNLSLDLFQDLKPTENTITTKPITDSTINRGTTKKEDFHSSDTSDIDIIKEDSNNSDSNFFTSSYEFSKKDFASLDEDDDFYDKKTSGGIFKIILLVLAITAFVGVIIYFIGTYGMGV